MSIIIAISGVDDAGKTTLARKLMSEFNKHGFRVKFIEEYTYSSLIQKLRNTLLVRFGKSSTQIFKEEMNIAWFKQHPFLVQVWIYIVLVDWMFKLMFLPINIKSERKQFYKSDIIIFDRYIVDHLLDFEYLGYCNTFLRWIYINIYKLFKPHLHIILYSDPQTLLIRGRLKKKSYNKRFYEKKIKSYFKLYQVLKGINTNVLLLSSRSPASLNFYVARISDILGKKLVGRR